MNWKKKEKNLEEKRNDFVGICIEEFKWKNEKKT
jgi:hypothetical protein